MTSRSEDPEQVEIELLTDWVIDEKLEFRIREAWLPMMFLENVEVTVEVRQGITMMERFFIETLLELEDVEAKELEEIASIPEALALWYLTSLRMKGLAIDLGPQRFGVVNEQCKAALKQDYISINRKEHRNFLWFPETSEAVVCNSEISKILEKIGPVGSWPFPSSLQNVTRGSLLERILSEEGIYGSGSENFLEFEDTNKLEFDLCPAYICRAEIVWDNDIESWELSIVDGRQRREEKLKIPRLDGIVRKWTSILSDLKSTLGACLQSEYGLDYVESGRDSLWAEILVDSAKALGKTSLLSEIVGLRVRVADEAEFERALELIPGDGETQELFDFDEAVRRCPLPGTGDELNVPREALYKRLWEVGRIRELYEFRESRDFPR